MPLAVGALAFGCGIKICESESAEQSSKQPAKAAHQRFKNKTIVITGGGGTFGQVGARYFIDEGANVILLDINQEALDASARAAVAAAASSSGDGALTAAKVRTCACDVRDRAGVEAALRAAAAPFNGGAIDGLWNNAGYQGAMVPLLDYPAEDFQTVMDVNCVGAFNVLQVVCRNMAAHGVAGCVVQTGSVAGLRGTPTMAAYVASKAAVHGLTMAAAKDLAPHRIRVNTVMPALIGPEEGHMWARQNRLHAASGSPYFSRDPAQVAAAKVNGVPLKRLGDVEEVVAAVAFLLSDEASYITGTSLVVAGGMA